MASPPFKVKSVYEYASGHDDDLNFPVGQVINVTEIEDDWYVGQYTDASGEQKEGLFPQNFVEKYEPAVPVRPARPNKQKQEVQTPVATPATEEPAPQEEQPPVPVMSKPQAPPTDAPAEADDEEEDVRSPPSPVAPKAAPVVQSEPPPAEKPAPAEPETNTPSKPAPPVVPKTSAFKDRIAAFNKAEAQPIKPMQPNRQAQSGGFIKKAFVAPPPSSNSYIPPVTKTEPIHKPYMREEDPEIKRQQEDDQAAAEAAGLTNERPQETTEEGEEDQPKPMSLKERMAMLQEQQRLAAERNADAAHRKEKRTPAKRPSEPAVPAIPAEQEDDEDPSRNASVGSRDIRQSMDRERPPVPTGARPDQEPRSPVPAAPEHEIVSGGELADVSAENETTEDDDADTIAPENEDPAPTREVDSSNDEDTAEDDEEELDPEEQRKQSIRERMARLAGGQGGAGVPFNPFGAPPPPPRAPAKKSSSGRKASEDAETSSSPQQRVPIMPMPGMQTVQSPAAVAAENPMERDATTPRDEAPAPPRRSMTGDRGTAPPVPKDRSVPGSPAVDRGLPPPLPSDSSRPTPRPPPQEGRAVPPPPPAAAAPTSPGPGSESDDERSMQPGISSAETSGVDTSGAETALPVRTSMGNPREVPPRPSSDAKRTSYFASEPSSATSEKRNSRLPPPIPGTGPLSPRPPPPPPPGAPSRTSTSGDLAAPDDVERDGSDYEGDYDTDIASSAKHKDALKGHMREASMDGSSTADEYSADQLPGGVPFMPPAAAPRAVPPPPPGSRAPPKSRPSMDAPRAPPPAPPPAGQDDEDYDPYRYSEKNRSVPPVPGAIPVGAPPMPPQQELEQEESSADEMPRQSIDRQPPPPPPAQMNRSPSMPYVAAPPPPQQAPPPPEPSGRSSLQVQRTPTTQRRSMEQNRPNADNGQMAVDVDLSQSTQWWTAPQPLPPVFQSRNGVDILSESEESTTTKRGGRTTISKDIYVLFMDYSQTIITARYDSRDPTDVNLEQRHEAPPAKLRQDQLEAYWERFGKKIGEAARQQAGGKKDAVVADGTPYALPQALIAAQPSAILPVGIRSYGALVYANLANASTMQFDEIRPGDIITVRNAKFEGSHGAMRTKYKQDYGAGHVAVVEEWDGTKRTVRAWEQGREKKGGVRSEKFRLGDLRSGEVRVWRVVGREWVGWE